MQPKPVTEPGRFRADFAGSSIWFNEGRHATAQADFAGEFGHETGALNVTTNHGQPIVPIDAYLK